MSKHFSRCHSFFLLFPQKGFIRTPQDVFVVHPLPDRLKLAKNNTRAHVMHRRSLSAMRSQSLAEATEKEKRSDSWCGVEGIQKNLIWILVIWINFVHLSLVITIWLWPFSLPWCNNKSEETSRYSNKPQQKQDIDCSIFDRKGNPHAPLPQHPQ